jgi:hypothetical protein
MSQTGKVLVTVFLIIGFLIIAILLQETGVSKTFVGLFALGLFFGIRAMWKKPKEESSDAIKLDKENISDDNILDK